MKFKVPVGIKKILVKAEKNSPAILTGLGIAGGITTTVLAVKATPKALKLIEEAEKEKNKARKADEPNIKLTTPEVIKAVWKPFLPVVAMGGASIACVIGTNSYIHVDMQRYILRISYLRPLCPSIRIK